jgi:DNA repair protein RadC
MHFEYQIDMNSFSAKLPSDSSHEIVARERLLRLGSSSLSDLELVSVITGVKDSSPLEKHLNGSLKNLFSQPCEALFHADLDSPSVARLLATSELLRRIHQEPETRVRLSTPESIFEYMKPKFMGLTHEEFHVLYFNSRNTLLKSQCVAKGSVDQCHVDPREVLAPAVAHRATGIVLVHNHPSGDCEPSVNDVALTRQLKEGARVLCIRVLDHLVIGDNSFSSMLTKGILGSHKS